MLLSYTLMMIMNEITLSDDYVNCHTNNYSISDFFTQIE